ncbi:hypothetical protein JCM11641_007509 [Rhodosporidiobolus odoratus]
MAHRSHRKPSTSSPTASSMPPFGCALTAEDYQSRREEALDYARENKFVEGALVELPVQWGEQDSNAHVNNVVYFRWLESGRLALMRELAWGLPEDLARDFGGSGKRKGVILARITFDYKLPVFFPDQVLVMHRPLSYSSKKMILEGQIYSFTQQKVVGTSQAVMVSYDYEQGRSTEHPETVLEALIKTGAKREEGSKAKL